MGILVEGKIWKLIKGNRTEEKSEKDTVEKYSWALISYT